MNRPTKTVPSHSATKPLPYSIIWVPQTAKKGVVTTLLVRVGSLLYAAYGMVMVVPVAAVPAMLAAVMLEGWTRPDGQRQRGTADRVSDGGRCRSSSR